MAAPGSQAGDNFRPRGRGQYRPYRARSQSRPRPQQEDGDTPWPQGRGGGGRGHRGRGGHARGEGHARGGRRDSGQEIRIIQLGGMHEEGQPIGNPRGRGVAHGARGGRGQGPRPANGPRHTEKPGGQRRERKFPIGYEELQKLSTEDATTILNRIVSEDSGFPKLLNADRIKPATFELAISVMAEACQCRSSPQHVIKLLNCVLTSTFLSLSVTSYITRMSESDYINVECISQLLVFFREMLRRLPTAGRKAVLPPFAVLEHVVSAIRAAEQDALDGTEEIDSLLADMNKVRDIMAEQEREAKAPKQKRPVDEAEPAEDFRELSVAPTWEDIHFRGNVFLRQNKVSGVYRDLDHYLDVQFRLLREDFMGPLRAGIQQYLAAGDEAGRRQRFQDIRVYTNVHVLEPVFSRGVTFRIRIDVSRMGKLNWERSKRLIYGSMVCLSMDGFQTVLFATVQNRDVAKLAKNGELEVRMLGPNALPETSPADDYVMVETSAYFEAYVHVLTGLQNVGEGEFAFQRYIVNCEGELNPPAYMNGGRQLQYDLSCLFADKKVPRAAMSVPVLQLERWPSTEALGLDESQLRAVQAALTREFAVIQGPPGTGKTYIGLKVVQTLLANRQVWSGAGMRVPRETPPILIVCFTNHALDQFLEGIHEFQETGIVRVGGRSQNQLIQSFSLEKQRRRLSEARELPRAFITLRTEAYRDMDLHREHIEDGASRVAMTYKHLVRVDVLEPFMLEHHADQLDNTNLGRDWLEVDVPHEEDQAEVAADAAGDQPEQPEGDVESEDEEIDVEDVLDEYLRMPDEEEDEGQRTKEKREAELRARMITARVKRELTERVTDQFNRVTLSDGFEVQKQEKKIRRKRIKQLLRQKDEMTDAEVQQVDDVSALSLPQRCRLYRHWLAAYRRQINEDLTTRAREYQNAADRLKEVNGQVDLHIMKQATVLGLTTSGAARNRALLQELRARIIVVEEAAEVLESHVVTALNGDCQHVILIGDHQQLRPKPNVYRLAREYNLDISLFERVVRNGVPCETLECQHRMRPEVSLLLRHIYPGLLDADSVRGYGDVRGVSRNMFFVQHAHAEQRDGELKSHRNEHEAAFVARLCRYLLLQGHAAESITVLTTYSGQLYELRKQMPKKDFAGVRVCVVDNYQGEENDIVLLSLVRSNADSNMGFLAEDNRVCVALSRARVGFYVIGNFQMFAGKSRLWAKLVKSLKSSGSVGERLGLYCQNHPDSERLQVSTAADFDGAPEGGCLRPCETRLKCGHVCEQVCHVSDKNHELYKCKKPCPKVVCERGHVCRRLCHEACGDCMYPLDKVIPDCGHTQKVPCFKDPATFICRAKCEHVLECGHDCANPCGMGHTTACRQLVQHQFPCGHTAPVQCCHRDRCPLPCGATLACGHKCAGRCADCHQGRLHVPCRERCERTLVCGHACPEPCSASCPPCRRACRTRCVHSRCPQPCGVPCRPCMEPCPWRCPHYRCRKLCHEQCSRPRCSRPCMSRHPCGHRCIGVCGETCPDKCRVCDRDEVCEVFFGDEDEPDAMFVQLEDCGHVVEVTGLDRWMDQSQDTTDGAVNIQLRGCPKCKTPIQRSLRYGAIVNKTLLDIEAVKRRIIGDEKTIEETKLRARIALIGQASRVRLEDTDKLVHITSRLAEPSLGIEEAVCLENVANLLCAVSALEKKARELPDAPVTAQIDELRQWALTQRRRLSDQEQADMTREATRLSLAVKAAQLSQKSSAMSRELKARFDAVAVRLSRGQFINDDDLRRIEATLKDVSRSVGVVAGALTDTERLQVVQAMGLSQGHWFKCPNGHIYAIGDCGGATEESKCPECKATIGGTSHRLRSDNRLAPEMDGAGHAAWSEEANLENYENLF